MGVLLKKKKQKERKIKRIRKKISGNKSIPRVTITQTNKNLYAQAIDDMESKTLVSISSCAKDLGIKTHSRKNIKIAELIAEKLSEKLIATKIQSIVLDRRNKKYHGIIKAFAEKLREKGIKY